MMRFGTRENILPIVVIGVDQEEPSAIKTLFDTEFSATEIVTILRIVADDIEAGKAESGDTTLGAIILD